MLTKDLCLKNFLSDLGQLTQIMLNMGIDKRLLVIMQRACIGEALVCFVPTRPQANKPMKPQTFALELVEHVAPLDPKPVEFRAAGLDVHKLRLTDCSQDDSLVTAYNIYFAKASETSLKCSRNGRLMCVCGFLGFIGSSASGFQVESRWQRAEARKQTLARLIPNSTY